MRVKILKSLCLVLGISILGGNIVYASSNPNIYTNEQVSINEYDCREVSYEEVLAKVGDSINEIPSFDSEEEAEIYLNNLFGQVEETLNNINNSEVQSTFNQSITQQVRATTYNGTLTKDCGSPMPGVKLNCTVGFTYTTNPKRFASVTSVSSYFSGFTAWCSWEQIAASSNITASKQSIGVTLTGVTRTYILLNSKFTEISSKQETITTYFGCEYIK